MVPVLGLVLAFSACGSSSSNSSDTPSSSPATSSTSSKPKADCSSQAILSALPGGATMQEFSCAKVGDTEWAAARVSPGDTVFFLQWDGTKWKAEDSQSICGTASAGLPKSLLSYCQTAPSSSPTRPPVTEACTSKAILAALPSGATMQKFTCANVGGKLWAAARVNPGNTVFFLQWNGTKWNAQDAQSICGTASAGLPKSLLSYCQTAPSSSPTRPVTEACTSEAIAAALPGGATVKEFTCANVAGQLWAAARVDPGDTVFFLQWSGTKWNAQDSQSICGTASAGLPESLLSYCR